MPGNIGPLEIIIVLIIALIVFGPKRLPELGNSLGKGIREFKDSVTKDHDDEEDAREDEVKALSAAGASTPPTPESDASPSSEKPAEPEVAHDKQG